jgi:hypothetical protein
VIFISKHIVPRGYSGITIWPFVFLKSNDFKENLVLINHEKIHLKQQLELFVIPFYIFYCIEFFIKLLKYKNWHKAYKSISFEKEAYSNEFDLDYIKHRPFWCFLKYL